MAFKIALTPTYQATVKVSIPNDKDGFDQSTFKAKFKRVTMGEIEALREKPQRDVIREVLVDFSDLTDENDKPVEFNSDNLEALLSIPQAVAGIAESFWGSVFKGKEKN